MQIADSPPANVSQLLKRAESLSGLTLGELADAAKIRVPEHFRKEKGWTGQLIELFLGAEAGSKPEQDFPHLGVELKTIPIDTQGKPLETTYVCYAPLTRVAGVTWLTSNVKNKLNKVLWLPIEGNRDIPPYLRRIASPVLWEPNAEQQQLLQQDWEELMDLIALGEVEQITARHGQVLQLRPKAADGSKLTDAIGNEGQAIKTRPRGFYLRKSFTHDILKQHFQL